MNRKKVLALLMTSALSVSMLAACGSSASTDTTAADNAASAVVADDTAAEGTESAEAAETADAAAEDPDAGSYGPIYDEYSEMSSEELYELAKEEGGEINVYATSSKMLKEEEAFEEAFPGLDVVISDLDNDEVLEKTKTEYDTGNIEGDVLQVKDAAGDVFYDYYDEGIVEAFYPKDICEHINPDLLKYGYPLYSSMSFWYYNTDAFPDGQPINSWWNILDTNEDGSQKYSIYTKEIGQEQAYLSLFATFIQHADEMEKAYEDEYGQPLEYTYDASAFDFEVPENNAGVEYLYRFTQLQMTFISDGDELVQAVANSTADAPALCLCSGGKIANRDESGYAIAWVTNLTPFTGLENVEYMYLVGGTDKPAGARLFIRWVTGDTDGKSGGLKPFMKEGVFIARDDVINESNPIATVAEAGAVAPDIAGIYERYLDTQDMWTYWLDQNPNM